MAKSSYRIIIILLLLAFSAYVSITGIVDWYRNRPPTIEEAFPAGTMVVGVDATFPPFAVDNGQEMYGIDIDLGNEIAERMEIDVRFVNMGFDGLYDALIDGQVDVVISALLINSARTQDVRYTLPYFDNGLVLVTEDETIALMQDLPEHSIALEYGSSAHSEVNFWLQQLDSFNILPYELPQYALDSVRLGEADSALVDNTTYMLYQSEYPDWESQSNRITNARYAIAMRYDREETWVWVNAVLNGIKGDGTMQAIIDEWFSPSDTDVLLECFPLSCWDNIEIGVTPFDLARDEITTLFDGNIISESLYSTRWRYEGYYTGLYSGEAGNVSMIRLGVPDAELRLSALINSFGEPEKIFGGGFGIFLDPEACAHTFTFPESGIIATLSNLGDPEQIVAPDLSIQEIELMTVEEAHNWFLSDTWQMIWEGYGRYCQPTPFYITATPDR